MKWRRATAIKAFVAAIWLSPLLGLPAHTVTAQLDPDAQFREISDSLVCQCGCNKMLSICEMQGCHSATPMRKEIREKLAEGESKETILAGFVDRFGLIILSAPPTSGFYLSAWIMPFVALLIGAYITKRVLASWKRQTVETGAGPPPPEISGEQQARIERELKDL